MSSLVRDVVPILLVGGVILAFGASIGAFVWLVGRLESWRIRRGCARITASMTGVRALPADVGPAWAIEGFEGEREGCRVILRFGSGGRSPWTGAGTGPSTSRALVAFVEVRVADGTSPASLAASLGRESPQDREDWRARVAVDPVAKVARFVVDPPTTTRSAADFWVAVGVAAEALGARTVSPGGAS